MTPEDGTTGGGTTNDGPSTPEERRAAFRVVRGDPSDAELAALTVVLAAVAAPRPAPAPRVPDRWSDPAARFRTPLHPGPGAWRASAWPR
ncbi:acyl-CoA carboxylase subunit epsilon [Pseudonocardia adelaidensis]|uniref:Acyl-CoA carboxylase subunit epsilon n=1 Tax=Pseudonocardia adelaidensis TaxID=648754 RepID=A0ABP9NEK7_9PSEU